MKKITYKYFFVVFAVALFCSCSDITEYITTENVVLPQDEYTIPFETALSSLESFMMEKGMCNTKGGINSYIDNYFTVSVPSTKAVNGTGDVLYQ